MKANPGGQLAPEEVVGRDSFIESLWNFLERQSIVLVAERRTGKTSIIKKMKAEPSPGNLVILSDVQAVSSSLDFVEKLMRDAYEHLSKAKKTTDWLKTLWKSFGGAEIAGVVKLPEGAAANWKLLLERVLDDLALHQDSRVIVAWDELPWGLQKITKAEGETVVVDLLDVLRAQRHKHKNLRMVFTGSLGLHHVVTRLHDSGYSSPGKNDMLSVVLPALEDSDAHALALELFRGEGLESEELESAAAAVAELVGNVPYYIHGVVSLLRASGQAPTPETVAQTVESALAGAEDIWDLDHFRNRLDDYYGSRAGLAHTILDHLAEFGPQSLSQLREYLHLTVLPDQEEGRLIVDGEPRKLRAFLKLMRRDHYVSEERGIYSFQHRLLRQWWRLELGLG